MPLTLQDVKDRFEIIEVLNRYAQGIDQRAWHLYLSSFTENALIDVVGYLDTPKTPEAFKDFLIQTFDPARLSGQHTLSNTLFSIAVDKAHTVTEFLAVNLDRTDQPGRVKRQVAGGLYVDDLVRTPAGWRIARRTLVRKSNDEDIIEYPPGTIASIECTLHTRWHHTELK